MILSICLLGTVILIWYYFVIRLKYWSKLGVRQKRPWRAFTDSWATVVGPLSFFDFVGKVYSMFPTERYNGIYNLHNRVFVIRDPELAKQVLIKSFDHFTDHHPFVEPDADPLWSNSLIALEGNRWKEMRTTLSPTFTGSKIRTIYKLIKDTSENFIQYFLEKDDDVIELEMKEAYSRFTNDVIATTAFGIQVNSLKDRKNVFYEMGRQLTDLTNVFFMLRFLGHQTFPKLFKYLGIPLLDRTTSKFFYSIIHDTIKVREEKNVIRPDMIHLLLEARKDNGQIKNETEKRHHIQISNEEITSQAIVFFFAGFHTVSTAICFGSYELALNKGIQNRLREEIEKTQQENRGDVTYEALMQMKYLDMVVSEVLRKWPPVPNVDRICTKPYTIQPMNNDEKPVHLRADQEVWIPVFGIHRDPKYFPNPDKFDPERFSDENKNNIVPYTYMPFGVGPRACIGTRFALLEIKALFFSLLLNYEIIPTKKTPIPLVFSKDFSQVVQGGFWLSLKRIKK